MRKLAYLLLSVVVLGICGCKPQPAPEAPVGSLVVENNREVVRFNHTKDEVTISFTSSKSWHITTSGDSFTVTPMQGEGSIEPQTLTIALTDDNLGVKDILRGSLNICLDGYSTKHKLDILQCPKPERTILAWFFGMSLKYYFDVNIDCMKKAISNDILGTDRYLVFIQTSKTEAEIKELYYDAESQETLENLIRKVALPEKLTADNFGEILSDVISIAPSNRYAMIVGGHSTAWLPAQPITDGAVPLGMGGAYIPNWSPAIGAEVTRNIGENNVKLDVWDFAKGLSATGQKFDWLYFDVCFMSSIEATYELRNNADYIVGSPCEIMGYGSPFDLLLDELVADDLDGACRTYYNYYAFDYYGSKSGCIATTVCAELDELAARMKALNSSEMNENFYLLDLQYYEGRPAHIFYDVEDYVKNVYMDEWLTSDFCGQLDKAVINRYHTPKFYSAYNAQLNEIDIYSGISLTPSINCIPILKAQIQIMAQEVATRRTALNELKKQLEAQGITPSNSEEYTALNLKLNELIAISEKLQTQVDEFNFYHPSLKQTAWYKATN